MRTLSQAQSVFGRAGTRNQVFSFSLSWVLVSAEASKRETWPPPCPLPTPLHPHPSHKHRTILKIERSFPCPSIIRTSISTGNLIKPPTPAPTFLQDHPVFLNSHISESALPSTHDTADLPGNFCSQQKNALCSLWSDLGHRKSPLDDQPQAVLSPLLKD